MTIDPRTDEALVTDYLSGDERAFDELFNRYARAVRGYIAHRTWYNDDDYIDQVAHHVFEVVWECLKAGKFTPAGPGSFRAWLFTIAQLEYYKKDYKRSREPMTLSERFPVSYANVPIPASEPLEDEPEESDQPTAPERIKEILSQLAPEELKLMQMVADKIKYKDILKEPEFSKYSIDYLRRKIYTIRQRFRESPGLECRILRRPDEQPQPGGCPWFVAFAAIGD